MSLTNALADAERRLAAMIDRRADAEEATARADALARSRADDQKCRSLAADYQGDYAAHGATPPMPRADESARAYEKRLLNGLQRRLAPRNEFADSAMLEGASPALFDKIGELIRGEAAKEAERPSFENLADSVDDPRAMRETVDPLTGQRKIEYFAKESFIKALSRPGQRVLRIADPGTGRVLFGPSYDYAPSR
jgi:hypothetical protein